MTLFNADTALVLMDNIALLLLATALITVLVRKLDDSIRLLAVQGLLLAGAAAVVALSTGSGHTYLAIAITLVVKVVLVPGILLYALRDVRIKREVETVLSRKLALPLAIALVLVAFYVSGPFASMDGLLSRIALPIAVSMLFIGLLSMLIRKKAISQVIGIVAMENGLYFMAVIATQGLPLAVELAVAIDLVVGVLVMGMFTRQIHHTFDTINTDQLRVLRG